MKSLFNIEAYTEIQERLKQLKPESQAKWGKMSVSQMLVHCQDVLKVALGEKDLSKPSFIVKLLIRFIKPSIYNDKPWKQGLPTAKELKIEDTESFEKEKEELKNLIKRVHKSEEEFKPSRKHPIFGNFKHWQWGQSSYKHLDHHFRQFGI